MPFRNVANNKESTLTASLDTVATTLSVAADVFPAVPFYLTLGSNPAAYEIVEVTEKAGLVFTIGRAKDGTTAKSYVIGDLAQLFMVAALLTDIKAEIGITNAAAIAHQAEKATYQTATGSNAIAITTGGDFGLTQGNWIKWIQATTNTVAVTINIDSKGIKALNNPDGTALSAGDLEAGYPYEALYSLGDGFFIFRPSGGDEWGGLTFITDVDGSGNLSITKVEYEGTQYTLTTPFAQGGEA